MKTVALREVAHSRTGEKIDDMNVSVIAYNENDYEIIKEQISVERVTALFGKITKNGIIRYEFPNIAALNFVFKGVLEGGRTRTLSFEESGKALSSAMLTLTIDVPDEYVTRSERIRKKM